VQRVANKVFITPTALGHHLNHLYNETVAELQDSKAKLVEVTRFIALCKSFNF
jgi:exodeoxyribonuclease VII large subunit